MTERHVAFDLDGTLVDMDEPHYQALNRALALVGPAAQITRAEHLATFKGLPTRRKLDILVAAGRVPEHRRQEVADVKQKATLQLIRETIRPDLEKIEVLRTLARWGWRICVCSNAVRDSVGTMLSAAGLLPWVEFYLSNQDAAPKPAPDIYLAAAARWRVSPGIMVAVEDAEPGKLSATVAGCRVVEIEGPDDVTPEKILPRILAAGGT